MEETHAHKCIKCNKIFKNDIVFYTHKNIVCPDCQQNTDDLIQYVTNLLYAAHDGDKSESDCQRFDEWVEQNIESLNEYLNTKKMIQKIERVPANICDTPFERAIDEKIKEMNRKGFKFIPPITIEEAEGSGEYAKAKQAVMLFEKP